MTKQEFACENEMLLTVKEAAGRLRVDVDTVYGWLRDRKLRGAHLGGRRSWSIDEVDLEAFIAESKDVPLDVPVVHGKQRQMSPKRRGQRKANVLEIPWYAKYAR